LAEVEDHLFQDAAIAIFLLKPGCPLFTESKVVGFEVLIYLIGLESLKCLSSIVSFYVLLLVFFVLLMPSYCSCSAPKSPHALRQTLLFARVPIGANLNHIALLAASTIPKPCHSGFKSRLNLHKAPFAEC
jgi:hypothetical protein